MHSPACSATSFAFSVFAKQQVVSLIVALTCTVARGDGTSYSVNACTTQKADARLICGKRMPSTSSKVAQSVIFWRLDLGHDAW